MVTTLQPLHDRVLVERVEQQDGRIVIPDAYKEGSRLAKVLAIGPGKWVEGEFMKTAAKPGDLVYLPGIASKFPDWEKSQQLLIQEADIGAIVG